MFDGKVKSKYTDEIGTVITSNKFGTKVRFRYCERWCSNKELEEVLTPIPDSLHSLLNIGDIVFNPTLGNVIYNGPHLYSSLCFSKGCFRIITDIYGKDESGQQVIFPINESFNEHK